MFITRSDNLKYVCAAVCIMFTVISYSFGFFESHIDLIVSSITREIWLEQGKGLLWNGTQYILPFFYGQINDLFPKINAFSLGLSFANAIALVLLVLALIKFSTSLEPNRRAFLIIILSSILIIPQVLTINSTRTAIIGTYSVLMTMLWMDAKVRIHSAGKWASIALFLAALSLMRMEAVVLIGAVVGIPMFFYSQRSLRFLLPLTFGFTSLLAYNLALNTWGPEEMKAFYYYENELIDRGHTCVPDAYSVRLLRPATVLEEEGDTLSLGATALLYHSLYDEDLVSTDFLAKITCSKSESSVHSWLLGGVSLAGWFNCVHASIAESLRGWWVILASFCSFLLMWLSRGFRRETLYAGATLLLPLVLAMHITVPARFTVPFFSVYSVLCILGSVLSRPRLFNPIIILGFMVGFAALSEEYKWLQERQRQQSIVVDNLNELRQLKDAEKTFIILQTGLPHAFMPPKLSSSLVQIDSVLFMDEYFTYRPFFEDWEEHCRCQSRSLANRLQFAAQQNAIYVSTDEGTKFTSRYAQLMHGTDFSFEDIGQFGQVLRKYRISAASSNEKSVISNTKD